MQRTADSPTSGRTELKVDTLTRRMQACDELAFREFFQAYYGRLSRYLLVLCAGDENAMRDALQETLCRVTKHVREFHNEETFWSWLTVLARSARADQRRRRTRYFSFLQRFASHSEIVHERAAAAKEPSMLMELLSRHLNSMETEDRQLLELKYFERCSVREISEQLEIGEKAIESRLSRIRAKLKTAILEDLSHEK